MLRFKRFLAEETVSFDPFAFSKRSWEDRPFAYDKNQTLIFVDPEKVLKSAGVESVPNKERMEQWADMMKTDPNDARIQPGILGVDSDGTVHISDGRHRLTAAKEQGFKSFPMTVPTQDMPKVEKFQSKIGKVGKFLPFIGLPLAGMAIAQRAQAGDYVGAGLEAASEVADSVPVLGTPISAGIQGYLGYHDMTPEEQEQFRKNRGAKPTEQSRRKAEETYSRQNY